jgi:hypothetical protein
MYVSLEDIGEGTPTFVAVSDKARQVQHPWQDIVRHWYMAQLTMAVMIPFFLAA